MQKSFQHDLSFVQGLQAHRASDEWNTDLVIPREAIAADSALFRAFNYDFSKICRHQQAQLAKNRISKEHIWAIFGRNRGRIPGVDAKDIQTLIEFAMYRITPPISESFKAEAQDVAPLRDNKQVTVQIVSRWDDNISKGTRSTGNTWYSFKSPASCRLQRTAY